MRNRPSRNVALSVVLAMACGVGLVLAGATVRPNPASAIIPADGVLRVNVAEAVGGKTVFGQLAVAEVTGAGFVTAYGCDDGIPRDSQGNINKADLNYDGQINPITSNRLIVKADNDGDICFYTLAPAEMIVDINGVTDTGVTAIANQRTDTRNTSSIAAGGVLRVNVAEAVGGKTVFGQLAVAEVTGAGFVTAYGCDDGIPRDSQGNINKADLNYDGQINPITSNRLIVKADNDGDICFYTLAPAEMIVDINGVTDTGVTAIANQRTDTRNTSSNLLDNLTVAAQNTTVTYDRDDWQHWIDADGDCQDTRAEVLIRDSSAPVTFTSSSNCTVKTGQWLDPWTTITFSVASDVDIDHTVPLANAHRSGGWNFSATEKRNFANDLENIDALRAMDDSTNSSKGSRGPESWKPPAEDSWCDYATDWASIKIRWELTVITAEYNALAQMLDTCDGTTPPATTPPTTTTPVPPNPGDSKNCSDFSTYAEAKAWFDLYYPYYGDVANLDGNGDLQPCESLPGGPG